MKITFDLQGTHGMYLTAQGVVYELEVINEDDTGQVFGLEGSLDSLNNFFTKGKEIIDATLAADGDPSDTPAFYFGPDAEEFED